MSDNKGIIKMIMLIAVLISVVAIYVLFTFSIDNKKPAPLDKVSYENINIGGDFELIDQDGQVFDSNTLHGKITLIYFGFTFCPDICPTSLNKLVTIMKNLGKYNIPTNVVFITIDPNRDNPSMLKEYLGHFNKDIIGLTGTEAQIKAVADKFKVYYARSDANKSEYEERGSAINDKQAMGDKKSEFKFIDHNDSEQRYMLDHTSFVYVLDKNGEYIKHFYLHSSPEEIVEFVRINK